MKKTMTIVIAILLLTTIATSIEKAKKLKQLIYLHISAGVI